MDTELRDADRAAAGGDYYEALRARRLRCRLEGHVYDQFKRSHPLRSAEELDVRVCFRCYEAEAAPVGQLVHVEVPQAAAFSGDAGWVLFRKKRGKQHVLGSIYGQYRNYRTTHVHSLCGAQAANTANLTTANYPTMLTGSVDDVTCKPCAKMLQSQWKRGLYGDMTLTAIRNFVRRVAFSEGLATMPKCAAGCLHPVHAGNCPHAPCGCVTKTIACAGCDWQGPQPAALVELVNKVQHNREHAVVPVPWGLVDGRNGLYCPACVEAAQF